MDKVYKIYRIDHKIDGEIQAVYIGYTSKSLRCRLNHHLLDKTCKFGQYWLAYTNNNHRVHSDELAITELASTDIKADAIALEEEQTRIAIKVYGDKCLNDRIGNKISEETRKKLKCKKRSDETKKKISEAMKGSKNYKALSCEYDSKTFGSIREAYEYAREHGYNKCLEKFRQMIKNNV